MQQLKVGSSLQGGKYKIEKVLGQGGFGITYLATQELLNRKVAIKEFFYKEYCERDEATSHVTFGTSFNRELVERFMEKFIKEARTISTLNHPHIIRIYDIFKENNTAYYVMEYIEGMSLAEMVKQQGALSENVAVDYIKQAASALEFVHQHSINHLDVKPANIMVRKEDNQAVLIDFGLSKQYDASGEQTSTTPVGISHGYAPMEQYNVGGVGTFSPQTDIYALGATLYKLVTGNTPPQAIEIFNDGLPELPSNVSFQIREVIKKSLQPKKTERYNSIKDFVQQLDRKEESVLCDKEETILVQAPNPPKQTEPILTSNESEKTSNYSIALICSFVLLVGIIAWGISVFTKDESSQMKNSAMVAVEMEQQRINDSIAIVRQQEAEKRKKDSIEAVLVEQARIAEALKTEEDKRNEQEVIGIQTGIINGHSYVDLGLSVKWATCNVGTGNSWEYGNYYAWGETRTKNKYIQETSKTYHKNIGDIAGKSEYDAANANWGGTWRLPTKVECQELVDNCIWKWISLNGKKGYKITSKKNGKSIFLPAAGRKINNPSIEYSGVNGWYMSSTPKENDNTGMYDLGFLDSRFSSASSDETGLHWGCSRGGREEGISVRPVTE